VYANCPPNIAHILSIQSQTFDMCDRIKSTYIYIYETCESNKINNPLLLANLLP
jgi:hypothetical protein